MSDPGYARNTCREVDIGASPSEMDNVMHIHSEVMTNQAEVYQGNKAKPSQHRNNVIKRRYISSAQDKYQQQTQPIQENQK